MINEPHYCPHCERYAENRYSHTLKGRRDDYGAPEEPDDEIYVCDNCGADGEDMIEESIEEMAERFNREKEG